MNTIFTMEKIITMGKHADSSELMMLDHDNEKKIFTIMANLTRRNVMNS
ncbi:MAG: hypothetical protein IPI12_05110 [Ignavibacteriales bacterium]|nr:hypothetical protein [Ignavibacteriales bacterium]